MKIILTVILLAILMLIIQGMFSYGSARTESHKYVVLFSEKDFEIREYEPVVLASVRMDASTYRETSYGGFRILAGYIFGKNESQEKIAMTSPVRMDMGDSGSTMSFIMPAQYGLENLPAPSDPRIEMHEAQKEITASLRFGGYANDRVIREKTEELKSILEAKGITYSGNFIFLGYNPPFQPINRRNEVMVKLVNYGPRAPDA